MQRRANREHGERNNDEQYYCRMCRHWYGEKTWKALHESKECTMTKAPAPKNNQDAKCGANNHKRVFFTRGNLNILFCQKCGMRFKGKREREEQSFDDVDDPCVIHSISIAIICTRNSEGGKEKEARMYCRCCAFEDTVQKWTEGGGDEEEEEEGQDASRMVFADLMRADVESNAEEGETA